MRISNVRAQRAGHALLLILIFIGILSITSLASYLALTSSQNRSVMRSLSWNAALPLAEAGAEEALSHINKNAGNFALDGWVASGTNYTHGTRTLGDGNYSVMISGSPGSTVTITSTGNAHYQDADYLSRTVQVRAMSALGLPRQVGLVASSISFGGNVNVDSYDSSNPGYSTSNMFAAYDPAKSSDKALVASTGIGFSVGGSSHIYGSVASSPGNTVTAKGAASVGDKSWGSKGIEAGHNSATFTNTYVDVSVPFTSAAAQPLVLFPIRITIMCSTAASIWHRASTPPEAQPPSQ